MPRKITGEFNVRREAELAVERLVQKCNIDRSAVEVVSASEDNTAGVVPSGADRDRQTGEPGSSPTHGKIRVSVIVDDAVADRAQEALSQARSV
jgi:hypothetical protein